MNRQLMQFTFAAALATVLAACGAAAPTPDGGRPTLPTGMTVKHPAAAANSYLLLLDQGGQSVYQQGINKDSTSTEISQTPWEKNTANARAISELVPSTTEYLGDTANTTPVLLYHWAMWHDKNANGAKDVGEILPLMSHDRIVYAEKAIALRFTTQGPKMIQEWRLSPGWSRAEHYVYLPKDSDTYRRLFESVASEQFTLHIPTPITSQ